MFDLPIYQFPTFNIVLSISIINFVLSISLCQINCFNFSFLVSFYQINFIQSILSTNFVVNFDFNIFHSINFILTISCYQFHFITFILSISFYPQLIKIKSLYQIRLKIENDWALNYLCLSNTKTCCLDLLIT